MRYIYILLLSVTTAFGQELTVPQLLQDISVTIKTNRGEGSGVIKTREFNGQKVNFVWTAGHVIDSLKTVRTTIDPATGSEKKIVEFQDAQIVKELVEDGRRVGELKMDAKVLCFSNADSGEDLALLLIRKKNFVSTSANFYLEDKIPEIGTPLFHVGSLLGQMGANSMTTGIVSQIGRLHEGKVYDQTTVNAFAGSSGGGVYTTDGRYIGMLVRGAGETFNLIVPVRRIREWAKKNKVEFAIDDSVNMPSQEELNKILIEDIGAEFKSNKSSQITPPLHFWFKEYENNNIKYLYRMPL